MLSASCLSDTLSSRSELKAQASPCRKVSSSLLSRGQSRDRGRSQLICAPPLSFFIAEAGFELMQPESRVGSNLRSTSLEVDISIHLRSMTLGSSTPILPLHRIWFSLPQCLARTSGDFWLTSVLDESECLSG